MFKKLSAVALSVLAMAGCAVQSQEPSKYPPPVKPSVVLHADVEFTPTEQGKILESAQIWREQTSGLADIRVIFDLDFNSVSSLEQHRTDDLLIRMTSDLKAIQDIDCESATEQGMPCDMPWGPKVLGFVTPTGGVHATNHGNIRMVLVADRLFDPEDPRYETDRWVQVNIHEFGHILGLPHVPATQAVMYPSFRKHPHTCLTPPDLTAFCSVNDCTGYKMKPCEG